MPAESKSQRRLMGMVHAYQQGKLKNPPEKVKSVAKHISPQDAKDFASTKEVSLPEKKSAAARTKVAVYIVKRANLCNGESAKRLKKTASRFYRGEALVTALRTEFPRLDEDAAYKVARQLISTGFKAASCGAPGCPPYLPHPRAGAPRPNKKKSKKQANIGQAGVGQTGVGQAGVGQAGVGQAAAGQQNVDSAYGMAPAMSFAGPVAAGNNVLNKAAAFRFPGWLGQAMRGAGRAIGGAASLGGGLATGDVLGERLFGRPSVLRNLASPELFASPGAPLPPSKEYQRGQDPAKLSRKKLLKALETEPLRQNTAMYGTPDSPGTMLPRMGERAGNLAVELDESRTQLRQREMADLAKSFGLSAGAGLGEIRNAAAEGLGQGKEWLAGLGSPPASPEATPVTAGINLDWEHLKQLGRNPYVQGGAATGASLAGLYALAQLLKRREKEREDGRDRASPYPAYPPAMLPQPSQPSGRSAFFF